MIIPVILSLLSTFHLFSHPDSVEITIENHLQNRSIERIYYTIPHSYILHTAQIETGIYPECSSVVSIPFGYINMFIFETDDESVYSVSSYPASTNSETISISLANKQFGGLFDRIYGNFPIGIKNSTDVNIFDIRILGDSLPETNILRNNVLLPGELLRLWIDSGKTIQISALDGENNTSSVITTVASALDTLYELTPDLFYSNGNEIGYDGSEGSWVVNCITLNDIVKVEAFSPDGYFLDGIDCSSSPLTTWDRIYIKHTEPVGYVVCTDENGRTYSSDTPDSTSGSFLFGDLNLDFGFEFPE